MEEIKTYKNKGLIDLNLDNADMPKIREDFIAQLENALMVLDYKSSDMFYSEAKKAIDLKHFDGAWLYKSSLRHEANDGFCFKPFGEMQVTPDMFPDLNIKLLSIGNGIANVSKYRFLNHKEKRNLAKFKYIFQHKMGFLDYSSKKWWTDVGGYGFNKIYDTEKGNKIIQPVHTSLDPKYTYDPRAVSKRINEEVQDAESPYMSTVRGIHMALQLSLTYHYEWSCYIKEHEDSIGIRVPIHPSASKDVFMLRNIEKGDKRKRAICNFVKDHSRTIKGSGNEREVLVKKHLRGDLKFNWRGLQVNIIPSPYDLNMVKTKKKPILIK